VPLTKKMSNSIGSFFQAKRASTPVELVAARSSCEVAEMDMLGHTIPATRLTCAAEIMLAQID